MDTDIQNAVLFETVQINLEDLEMCSRLLDETVRLISDYQVAVDYDVARYFTSMRDVLKSSIRFNKQILETQICADGI